MREVKLPTEAQFFEVLETAVVEKALTLAGARGITLCENRFARTLAETLVTVLFPIVREELARPRRSYDEITRIVDNAVLMALRAALD